MHLFARMSANNNPPAATPIKNEAKPTSTTNANAAAPKQPLEYRLKAEGEVLSTSGKFDCHVFFVHCAEHDKVLLTRNKLPCARWMPFVEMSPNRSWKDEALMGFCLVLSASDKVKLQELKSNPPCAEFKCLQIFRLQLPRTLKFVTRIINYFKLIPSTSTFKCCQPIAPHLEWFPLNIVRSGRVPYLWGPELIECCKLIVDNSQHKISEYSLDEAFMYVPRDPPRNLEEAMLKSLRITQTDIERMYADYIDHCFPSFYQTEPSFRGYMSKYKFERNETRLAKLFAAFNITRTGYLSFHELLLGLACMEPNAAHGEFRAKFIFRYYNNDYSGSLSEEKLKAMVADMYSADQVDDKLTEMINAIGGSSSIGRFTVTEKDFLTAIGSHRIRGTSVLCRLPKAIFSEISRSLAMKYLKRMDCKKMLGNVLIKRDNKKACLGCNERKYQVASHQVTYDIGGKTTAKRLAQVHSEPAGLQTKGLTAQKYSLECVFYPFSAANAMLKLLHEFANNKGTVGKPLGLMQQHKADLYQLLLQLYRDVSLLLDEEFKCQKVYSPAYIIGDIHGNIEDLLSMERILWNQKPCVGASFLFLGDYVDRGQWGLECALYIVAFKVLCPNKVTMLRGNHEVRSLQKHYSYLKECVLKYGELYGLKLFELTNKIMDKLPVSAVVDDSIYCAHGGIPFSAKTIEQITEVQREIREPEHENDVAWEILWSDPSGMQEFMDTCDAQDVDPDTTNGFVFNTKRGTAYKFNEEGANGFLRTNMLTHIIRAHEVAPPGYVFHFVNKCVTIFSCSHYCGNNNECGFIMADNQRLRVITLDTTNNSSATD